MDYPKGYNGPGSPDVLLKKNMLKRLRKTMDKASMLKVDALRQRRENQDSKGVSSVEPTYPGAESAEKSSK